MIVQSHPQRWFHKILVPLGTAFWGLLLLYLVLEGGGEIGLVRALLDYYSPFLFLLILIGWGLVLPYAYRFLKKWLHGGPKSKPIASIQKKQIIVVVGLIAYIVVGILPLLIIPTTVIKNTLPPKPQVIAHRGCAALAPENTLLAGEMAAQSGAIGWEVDVAFSADGELVLLHDDELFRTTNVAEIFSDRKNDDVDTFTYAEIQQLDAGSWFIERDPYRTIATGKVTPVEYEQFQGIKIPTLAEVIALSLALNLSIDVDLKWPSSDHPLYDQYEDKVFTLLLNSGLEERIFIKSTDERAFNMTRLIKTLNDIPTDLTGPEDPRASQAIVIDIDGTLRNEDYMAFKDANVTMLAGVVNSPARFSQLWCLGVEYVLSDTPNLFVSLDSPGMLLSTGSYIVLWICALGGCTGIGWIIRTLVRRKTDTGNEKEGKN
jgi:glycerophosphoryl diester phosphodiesterase